MTKPRPEGRGTLRRRLIVANLAALAVAVVVAVPTLARFEPRGTAREIASQIAERIVHGSRDDLLSPDQLSNAATRGLVMVTCGRASAWALDLLTRAGFEARMVYTLTLDEWNGGDNGHTMVSVREGGGWAVYDIDRKVRYSDDAGRGLSVLELVERIPTDAYRIVPLVAEPPYGEGYIRETNRRLMQVVGVADGRTQVFAADGAAARRVESYHPIYRTLGPAAFRARFYADVGVR